MKNNKTYYTVFYKSHGNWTGPYAGILVDDSAAKNFAKEISITLKSRVKLRKVNFK